MPPILWLNINFQYILLRFLPKKLTLRACHILSPLLEVEGIIQFWPYFFLGTPILNQLQMFPSECKIIFCGPHCTCRTGTFAPTCHAHLPHPPATPTSHTNLPHPPTKHISHRTKHSGSRYQVGVTGGLHPLATPNCHTHLPRPSATPTCHTHQPQPPTTHATLPL